MVRNLFYLKKLEQLAIRMHTHHDEKPITVTFYLFRSPIK